MTDTLLLIEGAPEVTASFAEAGAQRLRTAEEITESYREAQPGTRWVSDAEALENLTHVLRAIVPSEPEQALLLFFERVYPLDRARWQFLNAYFHTLVLADPSGQFLPRDEMAEVMASDTARDYVIGGEIDEKDQVVVLYRGTLDRLPVPFSFFRPSGSGRAPEFSRFAVADWGQTLRFGDYEASVEAVLYERDPEYRRRAKANRVQRDASFGGAFRRLRLLRGLTQSSFPGVSEREIRRIERNEVEAERIHAETRAVLERELRVPFDEIRSY